jgi:hypothetical protein
MSLPILIVHYPKWGYWQAFITDKEKLEGQEFSISSVMATRKEAVVAAEAFINNLLKEYLP